MYANKIQKVWNILFNPLTSCYYLLQNKYIISPIYVLFPRPNGTFLSTHHGRYLLGEEARLLMGCPIHRSDLSKNTSKVSWYAAEFQVVVMEWHIMCM